MLKVRQLLEDAELDESKDLKEFLSEADIDYNEYKEALKISEHGAVVVLKREYPRDTQIIITRSGWQHGMVT